MEIGGYKFPDDLYYDLEHNWARVDGNRVTIGITDFAQAIAGEIVYAEVPRVGRKIELGKPFMSMESGKWVGRIKAIVTGKIAEANEEIEVDSTIINKAPYGEGWLAAVEMSDPAETAGLLKPSDPKFQAHITEQKAKYGK
jgi:glycine cleavage system H protein